MENEINSTLKDKDYFELWRHCEDAGGRDKDRMVTIVTWLLGFGVAILGIIAKIHFDNDTNSRDPYIQIVLFSSLGILLCCISIYFVYAYGSYANRYWFIADKLKREKLDYLLEEYHDKEVFIDAINNTIIKRNRKLKCDQKLLKCFLIDKGILKFLFKCKEKKVEEKESETKFFETAKGLVGIFKAMRTVIVILCVIYIAILICASITAIKM